MSWHEQGTKLYVNWNFLATSSHVNLETRLQSMATKQVLPPRVGGGHF